MALVKVGVGVGLPKIVGIDKGGVVAVRGIVERVTAGAGRADVQMADDSPQRNLQGIVSGIRLGLKESYIPVTGNGAGRGRDRRLKRRPGRWRPGRLRSVR